MIKYLRSDVKKVNSSFLIEPFHQKKKIKPERNAWFAGTLDIGVYLSVPLLFGLGLGVLLDAKLGTKPLCVVLGLLLGALGSFFNLLKIVRQFSKNA